jgi:hypothetical protein
MSARRLLVVVISALLGASACGGGAGPRPAATPRANTSPVSGPRAGDTPAPSAAWTHDTVLRRIAGQRIVVGGRTVAVDPSTVVCGGLGAPAATRRGRAAWARFRCVQPTFPPGSVVGPDAIFFVQPTGPRDFKVTGARLTRY